jgi:hypothetical protein
MTNLNDELKFDDDQIYFETNISISIPQIEFLLNSKILIDYYNSENLNSLSYHLSILKLSKKDSLSLTSFIIFRLNGFLIFKAESYLGRSSKFEDSLIKISNKVKNPNLIYKNDLLNLIKDQELYLKLNVPELKPDYKLETKDDYEEVIESLY